MSANHEVYQKLLTHLDLGRREHQEQLKLFLDRIASCAEYTWLGTVEFLDQFNRAHLDFYLLKKQQEPPVAERDIAIYEKYHTAFVDLTLALMSTNTVFIGGTYFLQDCPLPEAPETALLHAKNNSSRDNVKMVINYVIPQ